MRQFHIVHAHALGKRTICVIFLVKTKYLVHNFRYIEPITMQLENKKLIDSEE